MSAPESLVEILHAAPGERTAIILPESGTRITYKGLRDQVMIMADTLTRSGVRREDRIVIVAPNGLPAIVSFLAASIAGTAAPLNPEYSQDEFGFYFQDTASKVLLCLADGADEARLAAQGKIPTYTIQTDESGFVRLVGAPGCRRDTTPPEPEDIALVLHTTGSADGPKRVPIRHANLGASVRNIANAYALSPNDVTLCMMPLFHVHGLVASVLSTILTGGAVVVPSNFDPLSFWRIVRDFNVTWYSAVPAIHELLLAGADGVRPAGSENLRFIRSCGAALRPETMRRLETVFGAAVLEAYGMTEAAHQICSNPLPPRARKPGSVGPGTGVNVSIMDAAGNHLAAGQRGEVAIQGANVILEYENNPEANEKSFTNGWFRTGDQGFLDDDGYLTLTGRIPEELHT